MRSILIAGLMVVGIGFAASSGASAAPVNSAALGALATATDHVMTVQYYGGYRGYGGYGGYGYRGYGGYGYGGYGYRGYGYSRYGYGYGRRW
jgi:hypothetical protein